MVSLVNLAMWINQESVIQSQKEKNKYHICGVGEDFWESLGLQGNPTSPSSRRSVLGVHWKDWCWSWNSNTLATWCEELTHLKRPWCWERLKVEGEGDNGGWDGWMSSPTQWTWVWINSRSWWWTGRPGMLQSMGSQRVRDDRVTKLNWTECIHMESRKMVLMNLFARQEHRCRCTEQPVDTGRRGWDELRDILPYHV